MIKKIVSCLCSISLFFGAVFAGIGSSCDTSFASESPYTVKKNGVVIYTAEGQRARACERMFDMSNVQWTIPKSITYKYAGSSSVTLPAGTYRGLPYTQINRAYSVPSKIQGYMNDAIYNGGAVKGTDCSSAAAYALRYAMGENTSSSTYMMGKTSPYVGSCFLYDGTRSSAGTATTISNTSITYRNNLTKVGWYGNYSRYSSCKTTTEVIQNLTATGNYTVGTIHDNVYAKMQPGDVVVRYQKNGNSSAGHIMLVARVELVYNGQYIDPEKSKLYVIDQIEPNRSTYDNGQKSSWRNDNTQNNEYTFERLLSLNYIPVTPWFVSDNHSITYSANGGSPTPSTGIKAPYQPIRLSTLHPSKSGSTFKGWKADSDPAGQIYQPGDYYWDERADTLVAVWEVNKGTLRYHANGGIQAPSSQTIYYGSTHFISTAKPMRDGYIFLGWSTDKYATVPMYQSGEYFSDDDNLAHSSGSQVTLYAVWEEAVTDTLEPDPIPEPNPTPEPEEQHKCTYQRIVKKATIKSNGSIKMACKCGAYKSNKTIWKASNAKLSYKTSTYTGKSKSPKILIRDSQKNVLIENVDYSVEKPSGRKLVGKYTYTIRFKGNYEGTKKLTLTIQPKKPTIATPRTTRKSVTIKWKKVSAQATGYQVMLATNKQFTKGVRKAYVTSQRVTSKKIPNLKSKKTYYVKVRTYKTVHGKKIYSSWSSTKVCKTKR